MMKRHNMKLYASYRAENLSTQIRNISSNVWNLLKPSKIVSKASFKPTMTPESSKVQKRQKNKNTLLVGTLWG